MDELDLIGDAEFFSAEFRLLGEQLAHVRIVRIGVASVVRIGVASVRIGVASVQIYKIKSLGLLAGENDPGSSKVARKVKSADATPMFPKSKKCRRDPDVPFQHVNLVRPQYAL